MASPPDDRAPASTLADRYRVLLDVGRRVTGTLARDDLYGVLYHETSRVLEVSGFYVSLYLPASDLATIVFYADKGHPRQVEITYRGSDSEVIRTGRPTLVEDRVVARSLFVLGDQSGEVTRSAVSAPLLFEGRVLGAISAQSYRPRAYSTVDLELLEGIAGIAAVALENTRHVEELSRRREEAERIEEIGRTLQAAHDPEQVLGKVVEACAALLDADGAAVWLKAGELPALRLAASSGVLVPPVGTEWKLQGLFGERMLRERAPLVIEEPDGSTLRPDPLRPLVQAGSVMAAPLFVGDELEGILWVGSRRGGRFTDEDPRVLQRLASQTALALENARLHANLEALTLTDPLTGLANRRHLEMHLAHEVAAARRGRRLAAVLFDLDDFKRCNDTHGHVAGDEILRAFGGVLEREARAMNLVARWGGDEFVTVLSDASDEGAQLYVERVRTGVELDAVLARYAVRVSSGMGIFDAQQMASAEDLLGAADAALYREKAARDRPLLEQYPVVDPLP